MRVVTLLVCLLFGSGVAHANDPTRLVMGYRNGKRIKLRVMQIGWAEADLATARAFLAMQRAAADDGLELNVWSGFRTHERQKQLYQAWRAGYGNPAAKPGFSNHQSGRALDLVIRDEQIAAWLATNAQRFGFRRTVANEPWHWEFFAKKKLRGSRTGTRHRARG
ncbi:MAG TPA: D-alanyl-D-alanine carboxypeptidase family protein [Kofleriaceae bacterium]